MTCPNVANNEASAVGCTRFKKMRPASPQGRAGRILRLYRREGAYGFLGSVPTMK